MLPDPARCAAWREKSSMFAMFTVHKGTHERGKANECSRGNSGNESGFWGLLGARFVPKLGNEWERIRERIVTR